jgi:hypothetical protein
LPSAEQSFLKEETFLSSFTAIASVPTLLPKVLLNLKQHAFICI